MHFVIIYYKIDNVNKNIYCDVQLNIKYIFNEAKKSENIKNLSNPFKIKKIRKIKKVKKNKKVKQKPLKISAIVSSEVMIDNVWYIKGDIVNYNKITEINLDSVELLDIHKNKTYILKVHNE